MTRALLIYPDTGMTAVKQDLWNVLQYTFQGHVEEGGSITAARWSWKSFISDTRCACASSKATGHELIACWARSAGSAAAAPGVWGRSRRAPAAARSGVGPGSRPQVTPGSQGGSASRLGSREAPGQRAQGLSAQPSKQIHPPGTLPPKHQPRAAPSVVLHASRLNGKVIQTLLPSSECGLALPAWDVIVGLAGACMLARNCCGDNSDSCTGCD